MAGVEHARLVERPEVEVSFKRVRDEQTAITRGWAEVEKAVGSLRGRKFHGVFERSRVSLRTCASVHERLLSDRVASRRSREAECVVAVSRPVTAAADGGGSR